MIDHEEIVRELDIEFLLQRESLAYKASRGSSGMQLNLQRCPHCGDSRWRTYMNTETGLGNCFVCDEGLNKLKFIKAHFDVEYKDAYRIAADVMREQGWRPKRVIPAAVTAETVKLPYSYELPLEDGANLVYLENRGVDETLTRYFGLRWCEIGWWEFTDEEGKRARQNFDNRVIIPVHDLDGELVTFQGRDLSGTSPRKYLFPKALPGTGRFLYNGQNVQLTSEVVMGEGAFDVIATKKALDEEVELRHVVPVGSFGKHLSYGSLDGNDQLGRFLKLKANGLKRVTIMWDGEEKALLSALNAAKLLVGIGLVARIALLPPDKDPNEVLPEVVRRAYWQAHTWSPKLDLTWRLQNPYSARQRAKFFPSHY